MSELRNVLPNRRAQVTFEVLHARQTFTVSIGWKDHPYDGDPLELFIHVDRRKTSSDLEAALRDTAILVSFALQFGAPLRTLKAAVTRDDQGIPATPIGAILDAIVELIDSNRATGG